MQVSMMLKIVCLIMIIIIEKGENVNVWIQGFDDAKVESNNKVVSTNFQRLSIALRLKTKSLKTWNENSYKEIAIAT